MSVGLIFIFGCDDFENQEYKKTLTSFEKGKSVNLIDEINEVIFYQDNYKDKLYTKEKVIKAKSEYLYNNKSAKSAFEYLLVELSKYEESLVLNELIIPLFFELDKEKYASEAIERIEKYIIRKIRKDKEDKINIYRAAFYKILGQDNKALKITENLNNSNQLDSKRQEEFDIDKIKILGKVGLIDPSFLIPEKKLEQFYQMNSKYYRFEIEIDELKETLANLRIEYPNDYRSFSYLTFFLNLQNKRYMKILSPYINEIENIINDDKLYGITKGKLYLLLLYYYFSNDNYKAFEYYQKIIDQEKDIIFLYYNLFRQLSLNTQISEIVSNEYSKNSIGNDIIKEAISNIENYYSFLSLKNVNWENIKKSYLPDSKDILGEFDCYPIIYQLLISLKDGHISFSPKKYNKNYSKYFNAFSRGRPRYCGIEIKDIENKAVICDLEKDVLETTGINKGWVVLSINGETLNERIQKQKDTYLYYFDNVWKDMKYKYIFNYDDYVDDPFIVKVQSPKNGEIKEIKLYTKKSPYKKPYDYEHLNEYNIGLLTLNNSIKPPKNNWYKNVFKKMKNTKGLIIDVRGNTGGEQGFERYIMSTFIDKEIFTGYFCKRDNPYDPSDFQISSLESVKPNGEMYYNKPIVILISGETFSSPELFSAKMKDSGRAIIIGTRTRGGGGGPLPIILKDGSIMSIPISFFLRLNGKLIEDNGIEPDIEVRQTYEDLLNDVDTQLQTAIEYLNNIIDKD